MMYQFCERARTRTAPATLFALFALLPLASPVAAQEGGLPQLVAPERSSDWMRGLGSADLMGSLALEFVPLPGQPQFQPGQPVLRDCVLFVVSLEGDVSHYGRSSEPVELQPGMPASDLCETAEREARNRGGGSLLPGDMFFPGDAWVPAGFTFTSDMLFGGEIDGLYVMDEVLNVAANSRDGLVRETGERWLGNAGNAGAPGYAFVAVLVPSEEREEFTAPASVILLAGERPWGMQ